MFGSQATFVLYDEEVAAVKVILDNLLKASNSKSIFLVDKNGQMIATSGDISEIDTTSLASLTAGNIAATGGLAKLVGEKEFAIQFHEGENDNIHISIVGSRVILVVIFDQRSSLGLIRLRVKKASTALAVVFEEISQKHNTQAPGRDRANPFAEITDDDIDNLFN
ncbi:MAG: dynein regulation protein LC7 [Desulfuromonadales bacterium C00003068]|jgi:predicted regulator of Ras-like GTPase activity (Roadblock/LC7/MglB family)|nr:roadblock/LC7 domain-containing protein [Deltaproteobacteria bacterium]OEU71729.1 MAG: dynein regulation protein LC7 [Desulfuromonadales bacterium C00003068]